MARLSDVLALCEKRQRIFSICKWMSCWEGSDFEDHKWINSLVGRFKANVATIDAELKHLSGYEKPAEPQAFDE